MAEAKIDFSFDNLHFSCEGDKLWVEAQLNMILNRVPGLKKPELAETETVQSFSEPTDEATESETMVAPGKEKSRRGRKPREAVELSEETPGDPLFEFLKDKNAEKNQVKKFLATAVYLHAQGIEKFSTPIISKTLKAARIEKLINASDCLNKNEKKGFCIKDDKEFILTESGIRSILGGTEE